MTDITIPPEALEAAAKAIYEHWQFSAQFGPNPPPWVNGGNSLKQDQCRAYARAAIAAALNAWPGMSHAHNEEGEIKDWATWYSLPWHRAESSNGIILPLPPPPAGEQE